MVFVYYAIIVLLATSRCSDAVSNDGLVVKLNEPNSTIRGHILKSYNGNKYYAFQDIPYALPPVGDLRFQEPQPHTGWDGILNTTTNTKICYQMLGGVEDCLIVNVYSPLKPGTGKLPVYFWIHGGGFFEGSCGMFYCNPEYLMDYNIVVVTVQYRLGPFGFLTTEDGVIPGNIGLKDQLLALKWVNKNIAAFGGDPSQVTVGGESAGSISTSCHILSQKATGLFRAAILESGTALTENTFVSTARFYAFELGKLLQPSFNGSSSELLRILQTVSPEDIMIANHKLKSITRQIGILEHFSWGVVVEKYGKNPYLTVPFHEALMEGKFDKVPILIGYSSEEILLFVKSVEETIKAAAVCDKDVTSIVDDAWNVPQQNVPLVGEKLKVIYTNKTFEKDIASYLAFSSDISLTNPTIRQAALSAETVPVYLYEFSYKGCSHVYVNVTIPDTEGVAHYEEVAYMWKLVDFKTNADKAVSKLLLHLWTNFIKFLNPTPNTFDPILGNFTWPRVTDRNNILYVNITETLAVKNNPKKYKAVADLFQKYAEPPFIVF